MAWRALGNDTAAAPDSAPVPVPPVRRRSRTPEHLAALSRLAYPHCPPEHAALVCGVLRDAREVASLGCLTDWPTPVLRALETALDLTLTQRERARAERQHTHLDRLTPDEQRRMCEELLR